MWWSTAALTQNQPTILGQAPGSAWFSVPVQVHAELVDSGARLGGSATCQRLAKVESYAHLNSITSAGLGTGLSLRDLETYLMTWRAHETLLYYSRRRLRNDQYVRNIVDNVFSKSLRSRAFDLYYYDHEAFNMYFTYTDLTVTHVLFFPFGSFWLFGPLCVYCTSPDCQNVHRVTMVAPV